MFRIVARRVCGHSRGFIAALLLILLAVAVHSDRTCIAAQTANHPASGDKYPAASRSAPQNTSDAKSSLTLKVVSENGTPIASAEIMLTGSDAAHARRGETDYAGTFTFADLRSGEYQVRVQKEGFYVVTLNNVRVGETQTVRLTLNHLRKIAESVRVVYSPPIIDPTATSSMSSLESREIIDLPYPVSRDVRYALPLIPGVLQDATGQIHVDGSPTNQILDLLDGFDITDPVTRAFNERIAPEALRSIEVEDSRYPARYGRSSGGILSLNSAMGDDHNRFAGVNFLPTLDNHNGLHISSWTPRLTFSGPLRKGRAWFMDGVDGEYDLFMVNGLPRAAGESKLFRVSNLAKAQVNLAPSNILTGSFVVNDFDSPRYGLSLTTPRDSTVNSVNVSYLVTARDQIFLSHQKYLELGLATMRLRDRRVPWGHETYVMMPGLVNGTFFEASRARVERDEQFANLFFPAKTWHGQHLFELGTDEEEIFDRQSAARNPFLIENADRQLLRRATFTGNQQFLVDDAEASSYAQDRWSMFPRLLVESGVRFDWDNLVHNPLLSPRLAATFMPRESSDTKLVAGVGLYTDATNLDLITRPLAGGRLDYFYPASQVPAGVPAETAFQVQPHLREPRVWNWSAGIEQKLPASIYFRGEYVQKREYDGWAYFNAKPSNPANISGRYELSDAARNRYNAVEATFRRGFKGGDLMLVSYVHSLARSNAVLDFSLDNPIFAQQCGGRLPWDAPDRLLSWGIVPLVKGFALAYTLDWRTGFPYSAFNRNQLLVGSPDSLRVPSYFSVDAALERRIALLGFKWDVRAGFDDLTGRRNPYAVNDNIDSPHFRIYSSTQRRALQAQIRLLGRK